MAARNKPAGIRSLVYGMSKGKAGIEGLSVSGLDQAEHDGLFGRFLGVKLIERASIENEAGRPN